MCLHRKYWLGTSETFDLYLYPSVNWTSRLKLSKIAFLTSVVPELVLILKMNIASWQRISVVLLVVMGLMVLYYQLGTNKPNTESHKPNSSTLKKPSCEPCPVCPTNTSKAEPSLYFPQNVRFVWLFNVTTLTPCYCSFSPILSLQKPIHHFYLVILAILQVLLEIMVNTHTSPSVVPKSIL